MRINHFKITIIMICIGIVVPFASYAQREISLLNSANTTEGLPVMIKKYENITGTPYLSENWSSGLVKFKNGATYEVAKLRYDQFADELHFESKGKELAFVTPVAEFKLKAGQNYGDRDRYFKNGIGSTPNTFYEVLAVGKIALLKKTKKIIIDKTPYNSATAIKEFGVQNKYYLYHDNKLTSIKKNEKSLYSTLPNGKTTLSAYIEKEKLDLDNDQDLSKLITYYNLL